jgi:hypothetical protein
LVAGEFPCAECQHPLYPYDEGYNYAVITRTNWEFIPFITPAIHHIL